jgi:hypothetical protein
MIKQRHPFPLVILAFLSMAASPLTAQQENSKSALMTNLATNHVFVAGRQVLRVTYLCSVTLGNEKYPVVDIIEQVPGAQVPRGVRRVVLLSPAFALVQNIPYDPPAIPLFCEANNLYFLGDVTVDKAGGPGNHVAFLFGGQAMQVSETPLPIPPR